MVWELIKEDRRIVSGWIEKRKTGILHKGRGKH